MIRVGGMRCILRNESSVLAVAVVDLESHPGDVEDKKLLMGVLVEL